MRRKSFAISIAIFLFYTCLAQNVGVGITTPRARLHVFNGASGNNSPYSPLVVESNTSTFINLLSPEAYETAILFGKPSNAASGGIVYNHINTPNGFQFRINGNFTGMLISSNGDVGIGIGETSPTATLDVARGTALYGTAVFRGTTHWSHFNHATNEDTYIRAGKDNGMVILNDIPGGKVGIGTSTSNAARLAFPAEVGKKITLYPSPTGDYGLSIQGYLMQIHTDNSNADIAFGYDLAGTFNERFRMKGNGAFVVNGSLGSPGQVLQSNGDAVPTWTSPTNQLYSNTVLLTNNPVTTLTNSFVPLPGLSHNFSTSSNAKVVVIFSLYAYSGSCFGCSSTIVFVDLNLDGAFVQRFRINIANGTDYIFSPTTVVQVGPGNHNISISAEGIGPSINMGPLGVIQSQVVLQIIPQ